MKAKLCCDTPNRRESLPPIRAAQCKANHLRGYAHAIMLRELNVKQKLILWPRQSEEAVNQRRENREERTALCERRPARSDENATTIIGRHVEHVESMKIRDAVRLVSNRVRCEERHIVACQN